MKRLFLPLAALAMMATSCENSVNDSYSTMNFAEYNLISDLQDPSQPAQMSSSGYSLKLNWTKNCIDMTTNDVVINNQKVSFEVDSIPFNTYYMMSGTNNAPMFEYGVFSSKTPSGSGAKVTNVDALFTPGNYVTNNVYVPGIETMSANQGYRLLMGYDLDSKYHVQTLWPICCYMGQSYVTGSETFSTQNTSYRVELNSSKNTARVIIYNSQFSSSDEDVPKAIVIDEIPIKFSNRVYYLEAESPKTQVLGFKTTTEGYESPALVDTDQYNVTDFSFTLTSEDLTEATIAYRIDGKQVTFSGCSIVKASK